MSRKKSYSQKIKSKARRTLRYQISKTPKKYVVDTSAVINKSLSSLIKKGIQGRIIIPNAVMAELENLANKGQEAGFTGLEEIAKLHRLKKSYPISIFFQGIRPQESQIKFAKSGEIDALIRETALQHKAILITADLVQAKSAQAYALEVLFVRPKIKPEKKNFFSFFRR